MVCAVYCVLFVVCRSFWTACCVLCVDVWLRCVGCCCVAVFVCFLLVVGYCMVVVGVLNVLGC